MEQKPTESIDIFTSVRWHVPGNTDIFTPRSSGMPTFCELKPLSQIPEGKGPKAQYTHTPYHPCYIYLYFPCFAIKNNQMWVNMPYMDGTGTSTSESFKNNATSGGEVVPFV